MLQDTFGDCVLDLLRGDYQDGPGGPSLHAFSEHTRPFSTMLVTLATMLIRSNPELVHYPDEKAYVLAAMDNIPELQLRKYMLLQHAATAKDFNEEETRKNYNSASKSLR
jgi:hypothetical protein